MALKLYLDFHRKAVLRCYSHDMGASWLWPRVIDRKILKMGTDMTIKKVRVEIVPRVRRQVTVVILVSGSHSHIVREVRKLSVFRLSFSFD